MIKNYTLSFILFFILSQLSAQTSADNSGIAIQGIARDANNIARANENIQLNLKFYYRNENSQEVEIVTLAESASTDAFGVFSITLNTNVNNNPIFANNEAYLQITDGAGVTISDEKLKTVPYSISAANGVPTGSIMPFMGTEVPNGWVLCDGSTLSGVPGSEKLQDVLGSSNVPNLQGMFLRGAGSNNFTSKNTQLGQSYDDTLESHDHEVDLTTSTQGSVNLNSGNYDKLLQIRGDRAEQYSGSTNTDEWPTGPDLKSSRTIRNVPAHNHRVQGDTRTTGADETAPTHFGVNYIIKL